MIVNRVGDVGVGLGIMGIIYHFKAIDYSTIFSISHLYSGQTTTILGFSVSILTIIGISLLIGVMGKSAQIGLHT
jgi:NADH-quinone oxidoreductase subunit L